MKDKQEKESEKIKDDNISRKDWLVKAGKYSVFTAASMMLILRPTNASAQDSAAQNPGVWPPPSTP